MQRQKRFDAKYERIGTWNSYPHDAYCVIALSLEHDAAWPEEFLKLVDNYTPMKLPPLRSRIVLWSAAGGLPVCAIAALIILLPRRKRLKSKD